MRVAGLRARRSAETTQSCAKSDEVLAALVVAVTNGRLKDAVLLDMAGRFGRAGTVAAISDVLARAGRAGIGTGCTGP
jgi:hypothetical protein